MASLIRYLVFFGIFLMFAVGGPLLDLVGWSYSSSAGSFATKIHPALFVLAPAALFGLLSNDARFRNFLIRPWFTVYLIAALVVTIRALLNKNGLPGQMTAAIVTFLLPAVLMIAVQGLYRFKNISLF